MSLLCSSPHPVLHVEPTHQFIQEPLQTQVQLTCSATQNDTFGLEWQVQLGGSGAFVTLAGALQRADIILSEESTISRSIEVTGTLRNSGSVCTCVATLPGQGDNEIISCESEPITVEFYGMCVNSHYNFVVRVAL